MEKKYTPCGGCGAGDPIDRCIGCFHPFESMPISEPVKETVTWLNLSEHFTEDWDIMHCRYADDKRKLDTDLFYLSDGWLVKKGGTGRLELHEVEYMVEAIHQPPADAERKLTPEEVEHRRKAIEWYRNPEATPQGIGWVKASERLPAENGGKYFVKYREGKYICHYYNGRFQSVEWGLMDNDIIEWLDESQPLPVEDGISDAVVFNVWSTDKYYYEFGHWWDKSSHEKYTVDQLYSLFKEQKY